MHRVLGRQVVLVVDRLHRAHRFTRPAVDALIRVDVEGSLTLVDAVDGAFVDAGAIDDVNARLANHVRHETTSSIYTINDHWKLISINKSKANEHPETAEQLVGRPCYQAFYHQKTPCAHCQVTLTLEHKQAQHWAVSWQGDDHLPRNWDISAYPIPSSQTASVRAVILWQDRTEERRLESSLLQAGKLAAIGQLAAGVAHEINNPLTAINANAEMLKMFIPPEDDNYEAVDLIARAGERATKVVRGLLDFARQEQYKFTSSDVNISIHQTLDLISYQFQTAGITIIDKTEPELPSITASWEHLKSVWLNLLVNARDAVQSVSENRQIEITTRLTPERDHVQVLFRDNGHGMSAAEAQHIFEPF